MRQLKLNLNRGRHGGRREGAGRRRTHSEGVAHRERECVTSRTPLHINFKYRVLIKNKACLKILKGAIINARKTGLGVVHFSLQHNHVHLIVEAPDNKTLTKGMRSLTVTFAKRLRKGKVQLERYHLHVLRTLKETRNAVKYVLFNEQRHGGKCIDEYSSLLFHPEAMRLIREFASKNKVTLILKKADVFEGLAKSKSYLLSKSLTT
jgi:REP element-mobilizing transposase RayT